MIGCFSRVPFSNHDVAGPPELTHTQKEASKNAELGDPFNGFQDMGLIGCYSHDCPSVPLSKVTLICAGGV